mgnify:CR=1 FL=1
MQISVYDSKESKDKVLICYIKSTFYLKNRPIKHCNVIESRIIAKAFNLVEKNQDPTAHAEILVIKEATLKIKNKYLYLMKLLTKNNSRLD